MKKEKVIWKLEYSLKNTKIFEHDSTIIITDHCSFKEAQEAAFEFCKKNNYKPLRMSYHYTY